MIRQFQITADGSATISIPEWNVTYHSIHGAIQESKHVFIQAGLEPLINKFETLQIFEMGFGTGLNALLTLQQAITHQQKIFYEAVELFPLKMNEILQLHYPSQMRAKELNEYFIQMHECFWEKDISLHPFFTLHKINASLTDVASSQKFHLIYYDAFAPATQPELWTQEVFEKLYGMLHNEGLLVTYCSKGDVRRAMLAAGFKTQKLKGPPGKREMLRAIRI